MKGTTLLSNGDLLQLAIGISVVYLADYEEKTIPFRERQVPEIEVRGPESKDMVALIDRLLENTLQCLPGPLGLGDMGRYIVLLIRKR